MVFMLVQPLQKLCEIQCCLLLCLFSCQLFTSRYTFGVIMEFGLLLVCLCFLEVCFYIFLQSKVYTIGFSNYSFVLLYGCGRAQPLYVFRCIGSYQNLF